ncbi:MAG: hypothetical protein MRY83_05425 [Flavobacteriales bacterium]|nr:hypothetical protein [Flavobacteriales bacterium]
MRILTKILPFIFCLSLLSFSCKKKEKDYHFEVNENGVYPPNAKKNKLKTNEQWVSILYTNLFQKALSANDVYDIARVIESIGDKEIAREVIISNFMNEADVIIPSNTEMRADLDYFIIETYKRFLVREPSEAEKEYFRNYITANSNVTAEMVYFSFALSNEYLYY